MNKESGNQLVSTIFAISRLMREKLTQGKRHDASSMLQIKTLSLVGELKNPSMKEIADSLRILSPSATDIINRLVKSGMLERTKDKADGRIIRLRLTPQGKQMLTSGLREITRKVTDVLDVLTEKEKKDLEVLLAKIIQRTSPGSLR